MGNTIEHQARQRGAVTLNVSSLAADVQAVVSDNAGSVWVELTAVDGDENAVKAIEQAKFYERGGEVFLELDEGNIAGAQRGGQMAGVQFGRGGFQSNVFSGGISFGSNVTINGVSMVNGVTMGRILVRAILPVGSQLDIHSTSGDTVAKGVTKLKVNTTSGDTLAEGVPQLNVRSVSGDIEATGITEDSDINTVSGDILVAAAGLDTRGLSTGTAVQPYGRQPRITASTVSGDVTSYGVDLRARTVSGDIRQR